MYIIQYTVYRWGPDLRQTDEHQRVEAVVIDRGVTILDACYRHAHICIYVFIYIYSIQYTVYRWGPDLRQTDEHQRVEAVVLERGIRVDVALRAASELCHQTGQPRHTCTYKNTGCELHRKGYTYIHRANPRTYLPTLYI